MEFPSNLRYTEEHEWIRLDSDDIAYIGITDFAQSELGELVYIEVDTVGEHLDAGEIFGTVEAVKTTSELYMPVAGEILAFNDKLDEAKGDDPTLVNRDPYGEGWIIKVKVDDPAQLDTLLDADHYQGIVA
ncbi:MAG: glycine cleavage system protein GcvH [Bacteroidetes bacterium]|nr:MAG: glycine cleavage system protein GcvH [Bacteroidota bacterium]